MVKVKTSKGLVARLLTVGIVRIVVMLLSKSTGAFLRSRHHVRASWPWAMLGHRDAGDNRTRAGPSGLLGRMFATGPFPFPSIF